MQSMHPFLNQIDPEFWRGKRVFVTGPRSFKGSWLCLWLQYLGAQVTGYGNTSSPWPTLFDRARIGDWMTPINGAMGDRPALQQAMLLAQPEIVLHLAEQPPGGDREQTPVDTYTANVMGTVNVLEAVRQTPGVRVLINITSNACYENQGWQWGYRETDPLGSSTPYSSSKACAEIITATYRQNFFNPQTYGDHRVAIATARSSPVMGGGDGATERLVPGILRALMAGEPALVRHPQETRSWQHVLEPLNGYLLLAEHLYREGAEFGEPWNFGPDERHWDTVGAIADHLYHLWGRSKDWQTDTSSPEPQPFTPLIATKAHDRLGWRIVLDLKTALRWVVDWTQAYQAGGDGRSLSLNQIRQFMELTHSRPRPRTLADAARDPDMMKRLGFYC